MVNKASRARLKKAPKKSGFVYKPRKLEDVKRRAEKPAGRFDSYFKPGFDSFRPKVGENVIRILPPTWEDSHEHYGYTIFVHSWVGPDKSTYLCPAKMKKKRCPICDAADEARKAGEDDEYKALNVREQTVMWVIDRDDDDKSPQLYAVSGQMDRDILAQTISSRSGKAIMIDHPDEGYDVFIKRTGQGLKTRYVCSIDRDKSPIDDDETQQEEILTYIKENPLPSVLKFYNEEYLEKVIAGTVEQKDDDTEDEEDDVDDENEDEEEERSSKRGKSKKRRQEEDDDDDGEDDEEDDDNGSDDDEEDASDDDEDDDGDEEEDEDDDGETKTRTKRVKSRRRAAVEDDNEEEDDNSEEDEEAEEEDDDDEEEEAPRRRIKSAKKRTRRK